MTAPDQPQPQTFDLESYLADLRPRIDAALAERLPARGKEDPLKLSEAMAGALLEGGKRLRPCLTVAACQAVGGSVERGLAAACAVEMVHAYSLVHDDLPSMDNDDLRRGKPTCHKRFGEATAILVGDALQTLAFETLATSGLEGGELEAKRGLRCCYELARAAGARGMVGGQAMDMAFKREQPSFEALELCHSGKTAALFSACTAIGAIVGGGGDAEVEALRSYGFDLGLAFQHADDLRDKEFTAHRERAYRRAVDLARRARGAAEQLGARGQPLAALAELVERRAREAHPDPSAARA
jgi:geranylgeranyl pyrophosphate synthase